MSTSSPSDRAYIWGALLQIVAALIVSAALVFATIWADANRTETISSDEISRQSAAQRAYLQAERKASYTRLAVAASRVRSQERYTLETLQLRAPSRPLGEEVAKLQTLMNRYRVAHFEIELLASKSAFAVSSEALRKHDQVIAALRSYLQNGKPGGMGLARLIRESKAGTSRLTLKLKADLGVVSDD